MDGLRLKIKIDLTLWEKQWRRYSVCKMCNAQPKKREFWHHFMLFKRRFLIFFFSKKH
jgi:hypothetical protein